MNSFANASDPLEGAVLGRCWKSSFSFPSFLVDSSLWDLDRSRVFDWTVTCGRGEKKATGRLEEEQEEEDLVLVGLALREFGADLGLERELRLLDRRVADGGCSSA